MNDKAYLSIRMDRQLHDKFQSIAAYEGRSMSGQILYLIQKCIREFEKEAKKVLEETGADHVVYAVKYYDDDEALEEIRFYMIPMADEEFRKDVAGKPGIRVYALHKMR